MLCHEKSLRPLLNKLNSNHVDLLFYTKTLKFDIYFSSNHLTKVDIVNALYIHVLFLPADIYI